MACGVDMTVKHFPGGGARENGFDPHYAAGQWNVYQTPGSLEKYHLPGFQVAVDKKAASIMPYYAKPAKDKSASQVVDGQEIEFKPYGFTKEEIVLTEEAIDRAVVRTLTELFDLSMASWQCRAVCGCTHLRLRYLYGGNGRCNAWQIRAGRTPSDYHAKRR